MSLPGQSVKIEVFSLDCGGDLEPCKHGLHAEFSYEMNCHEYPGSQPGFGWNGGPEINRCSDGEWDGWPIR